MYQKAFFIKRQKLINVLPHGEIFEIKKYKIKRCSFALSIRKIWESNVRIPIRIFFLLFLQNQNVFLKLSYQNRCLPQRINSCTNHAHKLLVDIVVWYQWIRGWLTSVSLALRCVSNVEGAESSCGRFTEILRLRREDLTHLTALIHYQRNGFAERVVTALLSAHSREWRPLPAEGSTERKERIWDQA